MQFQKKKILITVKAYPNPSGKYGETVCTAGIDLETSKWIRIYPVPWRDLEYKKKFKKYDIIEAGVAKNPDDSRPESHKINCETIKVLSHLDTHGNWRDRKKVVIPSASKSMCEIDRKCQESDFSLGCFKPDPNVEFSWEEVTENRKRSADDQYAQLDFFNPKKEKLEKIPYIFRFKYRCQNEPSCRGHNQCIIDWEIGESFRSWKYPLAEKLEKIKEKWQKTMFAQDLDTYLFVGNHHQYKTFMVLGVFWPPKSPI